MNERIENQNYISLFNILKIVGSAFLLAFLITRIILPAKIVGDSMEPTLHDGRYVAVNRISKDLVAGDIIIFNIYDKKYLVKRVIAVEGDVLEIKNGEIHVNGVRLDEPYIKEKWYDGFYSGVIPEGHIYVMGDNRNDSIDSRNIGSIKMNTILGKILFK